MSQSISRRIQSNPPPLSFGQESLWFLNQLEPDSPAYNQPKAVRLKGVLDIQALKTTLESIVARHEILRTTFVAPDGSPLQVVGAFQAVELPVVDLWRLADGERLAELDRCIVEFTDRPFDLSRDLMLRATLFRLDENEYVLLLVTHHIASDGWSTGLLFHELSILYDAFASGQPPPLAELPIQYADYAIWQRQWLQGEILERHLAYWKTKLRDLPPLELPTDRLRPEIQTYRGAWRSRLLPRRLSEPLKALGRRERATLFMTLLAVFKVLLYRYTNQDDIVVGSPIANRPRVETEDLIGYFINTLVLRSDIAGNPTFCEFLKRVRQTVIEAYAYPDLPFESLMAELGLGRTLRRNPLFQVMFALQSYPRRALRLPGLVAELVDVRRDTTKFDLTLYVVEDKEGLRTTVEFNTDLFDQSSIERMLGHFENLVEGIIANPDQPISELPLCSAAERHQLLEWNKTATPDFRYKCIPELFQEQVERTPDHVAVDFEGRRLTYRELDVRANLLAQYLIKQGVGPDSLVGIFAEPALEVVVGILGIVKAGGAFLLLDPTYPKERLAFMLCDTQVPVVLTQERLVGSLPGKAAQVICLDTRWDVISGESKECPNGRGLTPHHLAYVIYTSGSTGMPKGVMISHAGICNRLLWGKNAYPLGESDRVLQKAALAYDAAVWELLEPLLAGAQVVIARPGGRQDSSYLVNLIAEKEITVAECVPSMLQTLLDEPGIEKCHSLRRVFAGGEALAVEVQDCFFTRLDAALLNTYGPTEAAVDVTHWACVPRSGQRIVPIGRPIANMQIYILNSHLQPVPIGLPGELHIGGVGLARGYLNRPELTAEKFIPNPFSEEPGARLYKTGDLARYLPDGNIEFLGRSDHQVKMRGMRIELREIETVLRQASGVREVLATIRRDHPNDVRLVAYVVPSETYFPAVSELRTFVKSKLPDHMIPSAFVFLDALPLTPNGKIDHRMLPAPDGSRPDLETAFVAPSTPTEELLAKVWIELLKLKKVGIHDNFFELGGHSLLATRVVTRLRQALNLDVPLRSLFENPTIAGLAERIETFLWAREKYGTAGGTCSKESEEIQL